MKFTEKIEPWYFQAKNQEEAETLLNWLFETFIKDNPEKLYESKYSHKDIIDRGFSFPNYSYSIFDVDPIIYIFGAHLDNDREVKPLTYQELLDKIQQYNGSCNEIYYETY